MKQFLNYRLAVLLILAGLFSASSSRAQTSGALFDEIAHLDSAQFAAFNSRNLDQLMSYFDNSLEFYQDNTGVRNWDQVHQAFDGVFKMSYVLTRKLVPGSMQVYPIKDFGAIETAKHTFSHIENGQLQVGTFTYMQIWREKDGVWKVVREISYGH